MKPERINLLLLLGIGLAIGLLGFFGFSRLQINTDVLASLPIKEQVIFDAREIFTNHPIHDQIAVDLMIDADAPDILVESAAFLQKKMAASGLFDPSAKTAVGTLLPQLSLQVVNDLPLLFTGEELEREVAPRVQSQAVRQRLGDLVEGIGGLESIGQASFIGSDPLGLKDLVLARMIDLAPTSQATFYRGNLLSEDGRHLLLTARPQGAGTDTAAARQLAELFTDAAGELSQQLPAGVTVKITPVGAYRAALDNEEIIRHDVQLALLLSTVGIALLLVLAFPRPLYGLLSLLPSLAGTAAALFVYSLLHSSISIMVLGFGGALLAITVDHGIAYLLFLDRPHTTYGAEVAREVRSIGSVMALFTSIGAFLVLGMSDFPIFTELGQFAALGFFFTFLFIHLIFPKIIPVMSPAKRRTPLLHTVAGRIFSAGKPGAVAAILLAGFLLLFAKPEFRINLSDMNTVSGRTQAADAHFAEVWGDIGGKVYLMTTAANTALLQEKNDRLLRELSGDREEGLIGSFFVPSMIFPGEEQSRANLQAWREFWTAARVAQLKTDLHSAGTLVGFTAEAFSPFTSQLTPALTRTASPLPGQYGDLLGITTRENGDLVQFISITPGENYAPAQFQEVYGGFGKIFDPGYF
ncbi:MAG: MMPL family transporter, partial [Desulforhopalus sp.]|nr:MMPL family transporter [Desulforhopalus sp.]